MNHARSAIYSNDLGGHESPESERVQPTGKFFLVDFFLSELTRLEGRITAAVRDQPDDFPEGSAQIKAIRTPLHLCNDETALASLELVTDMLS